MEKNKTFDIIADVNIIRTMQDIIRRLISCQLSLLNMVNVRVETEGRRK